MTDAQLQRDLGRLEGTVAGVSTKVDRIEVKLDAALSHIERQKGARRATIFISSAVSSLVAFAVGLAVQLWGPK